MIQSARTLATVACLGLLATALMVHPSFGVDNPDQVHGRQAATQSNSVPTQEAQLSPTKVWDWSIWPGPTYTAPNGRFTARFLGRLLYDFGYIDDRASVDAADGWDSRVRILRAGLTGTFGKAIRYKFNLSVDSGDFNVQDAYLHYTMPRGWGVQAGQFRIASSREALTSLLHVSLVERASFINAFGLNRALGIGGGFHGKNWNAQVGVWDGSNLNDDVSDEKYTLAGRISFYPKFNFVSGISLAASFRYRKFSNNEGLSNVQYRAQPHTHLVDNYYVDTGILTNVDHDQLIIVEFAGVYGPWWVAGEWGWLSALASDNGPQFTGGQSKAGFNGGYAEVGWFLTGENRPQSNGIWSGIKVIRPVFSGGWGAWAIMARIDYIDLVDSDVVIFGGTQTTMIVGLNWHLTDYTAIKFNFAHATIKQALGASRDNGLVGADGKNTVNSLTTRLQVFF